MTACGDSSTFTWSPCNRPCICDVCGFLRPTYLHRRCRLCGHVVRLCGRCARSLTQGAMPPSRWRSAPELAHSEERGGTYHVLAWPLDYPWRH